MTRAIIVNEDTNYVSYGHQQCVNNEDIRPHATIEALIKAKGSDIMGGTIYLMRYPCYDCAKAIVYAGLMKVVYKEDDAPSNNHTAAKELLERSHVKIVQNEGLDF